MEKDKGGAKKEMDLVRSLTPEQTWVMERYSRMIGQVLTVLDAVLAPGPQLSNAKKLMNEAMYDARNELIKVLPQPYGFNIKS